MVVFAVGLAAVAITLALLQATSLTDRLMVQAERRAAKIAAQARQEFEKQTSHTLRLMATEHRRHPADLWEPVPQTPSWMDGLYIWDGTELRVLRPTPEHAAEINRIVQARLAVRPLKRSDDHAPARTELLYDSIGSLPIVLACLRARSATGQPIVIVGHINHVRLKTDLVDPMVGLGDGLEVVPVGLDKTPWARPMQLAMRFWAIRPTEAFRREQGHAVLGQTLAYVGLTLLALGTLLVAMWVLIRLARRETAQAQMKADLVANVSHELKTPLALNLMLG